MEDEDKLTINPESLVWSSGLGITVPEDKWEMSIGGNQNQSWTYLTIRGSHAPNWFFRLTQRLILGICWKRIKK